MKRGDWPEETRTKQVNEEIRQRRSRMREGAGKTPLVGDFVIFGEDLQIERISHDWGDGVQTSLGGSFYLDDGYASFSGSLNPSVPKDQLVLVGTRQGMFWFFSGNYARADNGVDVEAFCRVWKFEGEDPHPSYRRQRFSSEPHLGPGYGYVYDDPFQGRGLETQEDALYEAILEEHRGGDFGRFDRDAMEPDLGPEADS